MSTRRSVSLGQKRLMNKIVRTADERTLMRKKRNRRRKAIMESRPPANYSDPADLANIELAWNTIGDDKLKDDPKYIAPEKEQMNAIKKRQQLIAVQSAITEMTVTFSQKLQRLRELKDRLRVTIDETNRELAENMLTIGSDPKENLEIRVSKDDLTPAIDFSEKIDLVLPTAEALSFAEQVVAAARRRIEA
jgi:hypothetical protein